MTVVYHNLKDALMLGVWFYIWFNTREKTIVIPEMRNLNSQFLIAMLLQVYPVRNYVMPDSKIDISNGVYLTFNLSRSIIQVLDARCQMSEDGGQGTDEESKEVSKCQCIMVPREEMSKPKCQIKPR